MQKYLVIDNFLNDPNDVREYRSLILPFWDKQNHPYPDSLSDFPGYRTEYLHQLDSELFNEVSNKLKCAIQIFTNFSVNVSDVQTHYSFQYTTKNLNRSLPQFHVDIGMNEYNTLIAGVIYLNPKPPKNTGTILNLNGKKQIIENKFNRLLLYDGRNVQHSIQRSFGKTKYDSRLVLSNFTYLNCY